MYQDRKSTHRPVTIRYNYSGCGFEIRHPKCRRRKVADNLIGRMRDHEKDHGHARLDSAEDEYHARPISSLYEGIRGDSLRFERERD